MKKGEMEKIIINHNFFIREVIDGCLVAFQAMFVLSIINMVIFIFVAVGAFPYFIIVLTLGISSIALGILIVSTAGNLRAQHKKITEIEDEAVDEDTAHELTA